MKRSKRWHWCCGVLVGLALLMGAAPAPAQTTSAPASQPAADEEALHEQLRQLRDRLVEAMNKHDIEGMLQDAHPQIIYTPQDARTLHGHDAIRAYVKEMMEGPGRQVEEMTAHPTLDGPATLYHGGACAVASGGSEDEFKLVNGMSFRLKSRWTATLVRDGDRWLITTLHVSGNLFDNAVLDAYRTTWKTLAAATFLLGVLIMGIVMWLTRKRSKAAA